MYNRTAMRTLIVCVAMTLGIVSTPQRAPRPQKFQPLTATCRWPSRRTSARRHASTTRWRTVRHTRFCSRLWQVTVIAPRARVNSIPSRRAGHGTEALGTPVSPTRHCALRAARFNNRSTCIDGDMIGRTGVLMRVGLGIVAIACIFLFKTSATAQTTAENETPKISLSVPSGAPLRLYLTKRLSKRTGAPVEAKLLEPVFAFDREVIPAGTVAQGQVSRVQPVGKWQR